MGKLLVKSLPAFKRKQTYRVRACHNASSCNYFWGDRWFCSSAMPKNQLHLQRGCLDVLCNPGLHNTASWAWSTLQLKVRADSISSPPISLTIILWARQVITPSLTGKQELRDCSAPRLPNQAMAKLGIQTCFSQVCLLVLKTELEKWNPKHDLITENSQETRIFVGNGIHESHCCRWCLQVPLCTCRNSLAT